MYTLDVILNAFVMIILCSLIYYMHTKKPKSLKPAEYSNIQSYTNLTDLQKSGVKLHIADYAYLQLCKICSTSCMRILEDAIVYSMDEKALHKYIKRNGYHGENIDHQGFKGLKESDMLKFITLRRVQENNTDVLIILADMMETLSNTHNGKVGDSIGGTMILMDHIVNRIPFKHLVPHFKHAV